MANNKSNYFNKEKLDKLIKAKNHLEEGKSPEGSKESATAISEWRSYWKLPQAQRSKIINDWDNYYKEMKETPMYALFIEQREAAHKGIWSRVKELAEQAKEMQLDGAHITIQKPFFTDPWEFSHGYVKTFLDLEKRILELSDELNLDSVKEAQGAWE